MTEYYVDSPNPKQASGGGVPQVITVDLYDKSSFKIQFNATQTPRVSSMSLIK